MEVRPPRHYVDISGELSSGQPLTVGTKESFADNPLVVGQRYQPQDIALKLVNNCGWFASGVLVAFIGKMAKTASDFKNQQHIRVYEIKGRFGFATTDQTSEGRIVEKSTFKHITEEKIAGLISKMQSSYQVQMYRTMGIDIKSEEAFQAAAKGPVKPSNNRTPPILFGIRLTDFRSPDFTIEIECINEFDKFLFSLVHDIGLKLRSNAMCTALRLKQYGPFGVEHSLLYKHWKVEHMIENIKTCRQVLDPNSSEMKSPGLSAEFESESSDQEIFLETLHCIEENK